MYKKNTPLNRKPYLSTSMINKLVEDDEEDIDYMRKPATSRSHHGSVKLIDDSYKSLSQIKFDEFSQPYIDYYTCREYNKKLLKKLNNMRQNNEKLNEKINVMKKSFAKEIDINKNSNEMKSPQSVVTDRVSFRRKQSYDYILPSSQVTPSMPSFAKPIGDKRELLDKLFDADSAEAVRMVGNRMVRDIDRIIADLDDSSSAHTQNRYLYKKLDQLQRENERYRYLFEILDTELG